MMSVGYVQWSEATVNEDLLSGVLVERRKRYLRNYIHEIDDAVTDLDARIEITCKIRSRRSRAGESIKVRRYSETHVLENIECCQDCHGSPETMAGDPDSR